MQVQSLQAGHKVLCRGPCSRQFLSARSLPSMATPSYHTLHASSLPVSCSRLRGVHVFAASASLGEDVSASSSEAEPSTSGEASPSPVDAVELVSEVRQLWSEPRKPATSHTCICDHVDALVTAQIGRLLPVAGSVRTSVSSIPV